MFSLSLTSQAKELVRSYEELKVAMECEGVKHIELGADISLPGSITIRGIKLLDGKGHMLERSKKKGKVYGGTLFLMMGHQCEWKNVTISGAGRSSHVVGKVFGRLLEARHGMTIIGSGCVWKNNVNNCLAVDGGGALWIKKDAKCRIVGGEISQNENVSCGAAIRVENGAQISVQSAKIANNVVRGIATYKGFEGLGAAIYNEGMITIKNSVLENNRAVAFINDTAKYGGAGGAIYNRGDCIIMGGAIKNNFASQRGSAIYTEHQASLELCGGSFLSNQDAEDRPLWADGSCILRKNVKLQQIYIPANADVKVGKEWNKEQRVIVEPGLYKKGHCLLHGAKGNFVLKKKRGFRLVRKKDKYYIESDYGKKKEKSESENTRKTNEQKKQTNVIRKGSQIICERNQLVFYEGEYVSEEVLCYGVSGKDVTGRELSVTVTGEGIKGGVLDTKHVRKGSVTYGTTDSQNQKLSRTVTYEVKENRRVEVKTVPRYFFLDEVEQAGKEKWKEMLFAGLRWRDDCEKTEELKKETVVELDKLGKVEDGKYVIKGYVKDQYGHRYYMKSGEKRRYGEGKLTVFFIEVMIAKRNSSNNDRARRVRYSKTVSGNEVMEEWNFDSKTIWEIKKFMKQRDNPFSQETNQEFIRRYGRCKKEGSIRKDE